MSNDGKNYSQKPEHQNTPQKSNPGTTAVFLSIVTCVFMCALGYEIIQLNQSKASAQPVPKGPGNESMRRNSYPEPVASHLTDDDEYLSYELKILREQNRRQASKIKSLKQEIVNRLQEQHDLKATLFKQEGDPRDKARIAELNHQLAQKEMVTMQLQHQLKELEGEKQTFDRKMLHAEVTKEALTGMLEQQRVIRDQEISKLKVQINDLQKQKDLEHKEISTKLLQYEDTHQRLQGTLEESSYATLYLGSEITHLKEELAESHKNRKTLENTLLEQLYNTVASLELTEVETSTLKTKLKTAYLRHNKSLKENTAKIAILENEINEHRKHLKEKNVLFDSIHDLYSVALIQTKSEIDDVANLFEDEKNKSQSLEQELAKQQELQKSLKRNYSLLKKDHKQALEVEKRLEETYEKMAFLQAELDVNKFSLAEREKHLEHLQLGKTSLEQKYQEKISELSLNLHQEKQSKSHIELEVEYLAGKLELENARHQNTKHALTDLEKTLTALEDQLKYTSKTENELDNSNKKAAALQLELERQQSLLAAKEHQIGANLQKEQEAIARLESELENNRNAVNEKQLQLHAIESSKKELEAQLHSHIASLTNELQQERAYIASLENELQSTTTQLTSEKSAHESTKMALLDLDGTQKTLSEQHRYNATLETSLAINKAKLADLEAQLDLHQGLLETKDYYLQSTVSKQSQVVSRLEQELSQHKAELEEKHQSLHLTTAEQQKLERELTNKITTLTNKLEEERAQQALVIKSVERELDQQVMQVRSLKSEIVTLNEQLANERAGHEGVKASLEETRISLIDQNNTQQSFTEQHRYTAKLEKSVKESQAKAEQLQTTISHLTAEIVSNEQQFDRLLAHEKGTISALQRQQEASQAIILEKQQEIQRLAVFEKEAEQRSNELAALEGEVQRQQYHSDRIKRELDAARQASLKLEEEFNLQVSLSESYEQRVRDLQNRENEQIVDLKASIDTYIELVNSKEQALRVHKQQEETIHDSLTREISELAANAEHESQQSRRLRDQLHEIEQQYATEQEKSIRIQNQLQNTEQTVATLESELKQFHQEREHTSEKIAELEDQLNELLRSTRAKETADAKRFEKFNHR